MEAIVPSKLFLSSLKLISLQPSAEWSTSQQQKSNLSCRYWHYRYLLGWESETFFCKQPVSKYLRLCEPYCLYCSYWTLLAIITWREEVSKQMGVAVIHRTEIRPKSCGLPNPILRESFSNLVPCPSPSWSRQFFLFKEQTTKSHVHFPLHHAVLL